MSKALLESEGWTVALVEHYNPYAKKRYDLYGAFDLLGIHPEHGFLGVQTTTATNVSARREKIRENENTKTWLAAGGKIEVHGWAKRKIKRGGVAVRWECDREQLLNRDEDLWAKK